MCMISPLICCSGQWKLQAFPHTILLPLWQWMKSFVQIFFVNLQVPVQLMYIFNVIYFIKSNNIDGNVHWGLYAVMSWWLYIPNRFQASNIWHHLKSHIYCFSPLPSEFCFASFFGTISTCRLPAHRSGATFFIIKSYF